MNREIAVYKGDELLCMGTVAECAKILHVRPKTFQFYMTPVWERRRQKAKHPSPNRTVVVRTDE